MWSARSARGRTGYSVRLPPWCFLIPRSFRQPPAPASPWAPTLGLICKMGNNASWSGKRASVLGHGPPESCRRPEPRTTLHRGAGGCSEQIPGQKKEEAGPGFPQPRQRAGRTRGLRVGCQSMQAEPITPKSGNTIQTRGTRGQSTAKHRPSACLCSTPFQHGHQAAGH